MMSDTLLTEQDFWAILQATPEPKPIFYRLYYNNDGTPIIYSMEVLPGNYIDVDQPTYVLAPFNVRVVDGKITYIKPVITVKKLQPNESNGTACDPSDVCIVVNADQPHTKWTIVTNEID
jgi:hypothetical protein